MRQAIVIIHGIGEQRPMETLRKFVYGALGVRETDLKDSIFSKPDRISDTLELRRLAVLPGPCGPKFTLDEHCETDFYELYWQHLMKGTTWRPVLEWALSLLLHPGKLNPRLRAVWRRVVAIILLAVVASIVLATVVWPMLRIRIAPLWALSLPMVATVAFLVGRLVKWAVLGRVERLVLGFLGDAARYLVPDPPNVEVRRAIRTAGLTLLRGLHEDGLRRYERIVLVGHSLGSVIAYDLITWFWQEQHHRVELKLDPVSRERKIVATYPAGKVPRQDEEKSALEELGGPSPNELETFRGRQHALWQHSRFDKGLPWLITDLVTLGSPLAHADVLLADGEGALGEAQKQREFPTCPPSPEDPRDAGLLRREYDAPEGRKQVRILHHAAPFAVTRWTNLYFPGDLIGGPVSHLFGAGIQDVPICPPPHYGGDAYSWRSHSRYWKHPGEEEACRQLLAALNLNEE